MLTDHFSELENLRLEKMQQLRQNGIEPYPTRSYKNSNNADAIKAFEAREAAGETGELKLTLAGRLRAIRNMGKLSFAHIEDRSGRIQLFMRINELGQEKLDQFVRFFDLGDFIEDTTMLSPIDAAYQGKMREAVEALLATLTPREAKVLRMRFGIGTNTDHTLEEVGKQFDVTRERVRQIEAKALRRLKNPARSEWLKSFLDKG